MDNALLQLEKESESIQPLSIWANVFSEIRKTPVLSREEEQRLFQELETNSSDEIKNKIIVSNLRLVLALTSKIARSRGLHSLNFYDLFQEGTLGLMKAVEQFDWKKGYKFSTYAFWWVRQTTLRAIDDKENLIRIPVHFQGKRRAFFRGLERLDQKLGRNPISTELAQELGISLSELAEIKNTFLLGANMSLNAPLTEEGDGEFIDVVEDKKSVSPEDIAEESQRREAVLKTLELLGDTFQDVRQRKVLRLRSGLEDGRPWTLEEIGREFRVTRERIRQIEAKALRRLRSNGKTREILKDFVR